MIGVTHGQGENAGRHPLMATAVPHRPFLPPSLAARDFPGRPPIALRIHQVILFLPAQHEAQRESKEQTEPETAGEALIKDVQDPSLERHLEQELALFIAFEGGASTTTGPPMHACQIGGSCCWSRPTRITASQCRPGTKMGPRGGV